MGAALLDTASLDPAFVDATDDLPATAGNAHAVPRHSNQTVTYASANAVSTEALRRQVAERLAAHRLRREPAQPTAERSPSASTPARNSRIAAAVQRRYAQSPSYRAYLAAEAERAAQQAQAAAEVAALNAQAIAHAQRQLMDDLRQDEPNQDDSGLYETSLNETGLHETGLHETGLYEAGLYEANQDNPSRADLNQGSPDRDACEAERHSQLPLERTLWPEAQPDSPAASTARTRSSKPPSPSHPTRNGASLPNPPSLTARLLQGNDCPESDRPLASALQAPPLPSSSANATRQLPQQDYGDEARALDEEIAFRQSPFFEEPASAPIPLSANLIEFPRQLVAPRKARPHYAEGPLRAADDASLTGGQLRIFEVDPAQISTTPVAAEAVPAAQWTSLWLDGPVPGRTDAAHSHQPEPDPSAEEEDAVGAAPLPQVASIGRRLMAVAIDASIILTGFLAAIVLLLVVGHAGDWQTAAAIPASLPNPSLPNPSLHLGLAHAAVQTAAQAAAPIIGEITLHTGLQPGIALGTSAVALVLLFFLYQTLFFFFSDSTLGMRSVRIALCTFDDENPSRRTLRRRILALLVSTCPLGLGLFWALFDEDRLAWHDRLSQTYQRCY